MILELNQLFVLNLLWSDNGGKPCASAIFRLAPSNTWNRPAAHLIACFLFDVQVISTPCQEWVRSNSVLCIYQECLPTTCTTKLRIIRCTTPTPHPKSSTTPVPDADVCSHRGCSSSHPQLLRPRSLSLHKTHAVFFMWATVKFVLSSHLISLI